MREKNKHKEGRQDKMEYRIVCWNCKNPFFDLNRFTRYCGKECRKQHQKDVAMELRELKKKQVSIGDSIEGKGRL